VDLGKVYSNILTFKAPFWY